MKSKTIAASACYISPAGIKHSKTRANHPQAQRGVSLIELMVGLTIGLLVVAVAMSALMVSRGVSSTVSDASTIQQQAAYVLRVLGLQLRQAGSLYLNPNPTNAPGVNEYMTTVAFEMESGDFKPANAIKGKDDTAGNELTVGYRDYSYPAYNSAAAQFRDCLGQNGANALVQSRFVHDSTNFVLRCVSTNPGATLQPIVQNVATFQVRYLTQDVTTKIGNPQIKYANAAAVGTDWSKVLGVEVCLVLYGIEPIDMPAGSSYTDCDGTTAVNMTTLTGARARRMHLVFRNVYQLRSQGLM